MEFKIFSKQNIEKYVGDQPYALISIAGKAPSNTTNNMGQHGFAELTDDPNRKDLLQITFDDISYNNDDAKYPIPEGTIFEDLIYFNKDHADEIINFSKSKEIKDNIDLICVNCYAGISRSSGVASALEVIHNGMRSDQWIWDSPMYYPNSLVYKTILYRWDELLSYNMTI